MTDYQIGVFALTVQSPRQIVLVTSRTGERWIFPKGQREKGRADKEVALDEAYEEAGLIGRIASKRNAFEVGHGKTKQLHLYYMEIDQVLSSWPEAKQRQRAIVPLDKAEQLLDKDLRRCLRAMARAFPPAP